MAKENVTNGPPPSAEELTKFTAEATKARADAAHAKAQARLIAAQAATCEIMLDREQDKRAIELAADDHHRIYRFAGPVGEGSTKSCMAKLATWHRLDPGCPMEIVFSSPGGSIVDGMALFDFIQQMRAADHHVTTSSIGIAASMAGILLQAGDVRVMSPQAWLLIHEAQFGTVGSFGEVEDMVEWVKGVQERILTIFADRSNMTKLQIKRRWHRKDWWISSDDALKHGFIDEIR